MLGAILELIHLNNMTALYRSRRPRSSGDGRLGYAKTFFIIKPLLFFSVDWD